ncbi:hypothetical protein OBK01_11010 [Empedobacter falsenii]
MKNLLRFLFLIGSTFAYSQIGVKTQTPQTELDVNGTMNVKDEIYLGDENNGKGNPGKLGDLISSNGDKQPSWKNFDLPTGYGKEMMLKSSYNISSTKGITISNQGNQNTSVGYTQGQGKTNPSQWKTIEGLNQKFTVDNETNRVNISVQALVQMQGDSGNASFGCGIFLDNKLKLARTSSVIGKSGSYVVVNLSTTMENLSPKTYEFSFACVERNIPRNTKIGIGEPLDTSLLNAEMAKTTGSIKIFEHL